MILVSKFRLHIVVLLCICGLVCSCGVNIAEEDVAAVHVSLSGSGFSYQKIKKGGKS